MDLYIFATPYRVTWDYYFLAREHTLDFDEWEGENEFEHVRKDISCPQLLIRIFLLISFNFVYN